MSIYMYVYSILWSVHKYLEHEHTRTLITISHYTTINSQSFYIYITSIGQIYKICFSFQSLESFPGYPAMSKALNKTGRPIMYSCSWPAYIANVSLMLPIMNVL